MSDWSDWSDWSGWSGWTYERCEAVESENAIDAVRKLTASYENYAAAHSAVPPRYGCTDSEYSKASGE